MDYPVIGRLVEGIAVGAIGGIMAAAVWALIVWKYSCVQEGNITRTLTEGITFEGYGGINRSPYLRINNFNPFPLVVCGVMLEFSDWDEKYYVQRVEREIGADDESVDTTIELLPGQWSKWVFTPGIDIPDTVNNLTSCTVYIKYPTRVSPDNYLEYTVRGEALRTLQDQVRSNKRNSN